MPVPGTLICPLLDARRSEIYCALYRRSPEPPYPLEPLIPPAAVALESFLRQLDRCDGPIVFTGEGLATYGPSLDAALGSRAILLPAPLRLCSAARVALCGRRLLELDPAAPYERLLPQYLRRPEAERRLAERKGAPPCR